MGEPVRQIRPSPLTPESWAPFGWIPVADTDPADGDDLLAYEWNDVHVNRIAHRRDEVAEVPGGLRCTALFRHRTHTQVLMPLDVTSVLAVAPASVDLRSSAEAGLIEAFVLEPLESIVLHQGTWHWGPFPVSADEVHLFNVQGLRYAEDNECADIGALGAAVDVLVEG
jgi:ureidoglycolate hydrolase